MDEYVINLGKLVANLHSLEFVLRAFLLNHSRARGIPQIDYNGLNVGDTVAEDAFTNYDSLAELIDKYNAAVLTIDASLAIPKDVVGVRDAIAHGRVSSDTLSAPMKLLKFSRPKGGHVTVTHAVSVDTRWLADRYREVAASLRKVADANGRVAGYV